jgi:hypothetical protein
VSKNIAQGGPLQRGWINIALPKIVPGGHYPKMRGIVGVSATRQAMVEGHMEKRIICLAVSLVIFVFSPAHAFILLGEGETDRPGCDFSRFVVPRANDPFFSVVCANACGRDPNCQAWNFDTRFDGSGAATCFLKNCVPAQIQSRATYGGVKLQATMSGSEPSIDRVGCDYASLPAEAPQICLAACARDTRCQAWNYDPKSGAPKCALKNCVPAPTVTPSTPPVVSGVKFSN